MRMFIITLRNMKTKDEFKFEYSSPKPSVAPIEAVYVAMDKFPSYSIIKVEERMYNAKLIAKHGEFKELKGYMNYQRRLVVG